MPKRRGGDAVLTAIDECNIAGFALIPSQKTLPPSKLVWTRQVAGASGKMLTVTCRGMPDIGLPRGIDGDILVSLLNAYVEAGCPEDGVIYVTPYAVLTGPGLAVTKAYYERLAKSLARMKSATYSITDGWFDLERARYLTVTFNLLTDVEYTHGDQGLDERSTLRIQLSERITKSIRDGYVKPLNLSLYRQLSSSGARTLYRMLDLRLFEQAQGSKAPYHLTVSLLDWGAQCGILDTAPDKIRRALEPMHASLLNEGYLHSVSYSGIGRRTSILYVYGERSALAEPEHVEALKRYGVHPTQAEKYARELGSKVLQVIEAFEEVKQRRAGGKSPIENDARYLSTMLKNAEALLEEQQAKKDAQAAQRARQAQAKKRVQQEVLLVETQLAAERQQLAAGAVTPEVVDKLFSSFNIGLLTRAKSGSNLSLQAVDNLKGAVLAGRLEAKVMAELMWQVTLGGPGREAAIAQLKTLSTSPLN
ncbi:Plasmid replication initiator repA-related protein (plasmid) [Deinococcus geothermalis DSM 11300]|uniref:Plasmid replication initiator repA-related protein n=1 Tax=Deinococcus geothermalis (strain DSM 11300 / CIP 105573 / AG-3a) TaxID=319795 RepID=A8ZRM1_DEIGD|nr:MULTISPECIES: replication initiator protein A [Deinococcus]ABW35130.1 Plasmid replication initiator repA-related protein [Deinococcus geothermalis DSM 11300]TDE84641.1 plasmid replication initiator repA-like protein [Deinococcus sp. S9]